MTEAGAYSSIGGWLVLVGIGVVLSPLVILFQTLALFGDLVTSGAWEALTTPGTQAYDPRWASFLYIEGGVNLALIALWGYLNYLFFTKKRRFPGLYIFALLAGIVVILGDAFAFRLLVPDEPVFDPETRKRVARSLIAAVIWVPYMLVSKRVAGTFVR